LAQERLVEVQAARRKADEANEVAQKVRFFFQYTVLGPQNLQKQASGEPYNNVVVGGIREEATENPTIRELLVRAAKELKPDRIEATFPKQPLLQAGFLTSVGSTYLEMGEYALAIGFLERAVELYKQQLGPVHTTTIHSMNCLVLAYCRMGRFPEAVPLAEHDYNANLKKYGPEDTGTLTLMHNLGRCYVDAGNLAEGIALLERAYAIRKNKFGADQPRTLFTLDHLAGAYRAAGNLPAAIASWEQLRDARVRLLGADHPATLDTRVDLAGAYLAAGKADLAQPLVKEMLAKTRKVLPEDRLQFAAHLARLGLSLLQAKAFTEAELLLRECLAIREKAQPDFWSTFDTQSMLGGALLGQKKYGEAEPLLLAGYEGMKKREATIPPPARPRLAEAALRLVQLYEALGKKDEAARWTRERDAIKLLEK
jgi:tetratricopeptide (TPR) repeat protein